MNRNSDYPFIGGGRRSTVAGTGGGPHRRQQHQQEVDGGDIDPLESMREQFDRDRDAFFEGGSNGGVSGPTRHQSLFGMPQGADPFFSRQPRGFDSFPRRFEQMGNFPEPHFTHPQPSPFYEQQHPQQHPQQHSQPQSGRPQQRAQSTSESIPIRVVHERTQQASSPSAAGSPRSKYTGSRNTTELPARSSPHNSPRLERAHSEPPKAFNQRLFASKPSFGAPIPEGDMAGAPGQYTQGLSVSPNNLSTSASAPSVPSSQQPDVGAPVPPPRRPSPTKMRQQQQHQEEPRKESVRHIPIFVEGRDAPVINRDRTTAAGGPYRKPADFYPSGAKKVPTVDKRQPVEPTTPIGPPPGPIPMGCSPQHMNVPPSKPAEPTSPLPCPDGPIPLPCSPDLYQQKPDPEVVTPPKEPSPERASSSAQKEVAGANQKDARSETPPKVFNVPINLNVKPTDQPDNTAHVPVPPPQPPKPAAPAEPQRKLTAEELAMEKMQKVKEQVAELVKRIEAFKGDKKDKEYRYLDEMLTRHLLALDSVETHGKDELRSLRKESIKTVNRCLSVLDHKAKASSDAEDNNAILSQLAKVTEEQQAKK